MSVLLNISCADISSNETSERYNLIEFYWINLYFLKVRRKNLRYNNKNNLQVHWNDKNKKKNVNLKISIYLCFTTFVLLNKKIYLEFWVSIQKFILCELIRMTCDITRRLKLLWLKIFKVNKIYEYVKLCQMEVFITTSKDFCSFTRRNVMILNGFDKCSTSNWSLINKIHFWLKINVCLKETNFTSIVYELGQTFMGSFRQLPKRREMITH